MFPCASFQDLRHSASQAPEPAHDLGDLLLIAEGAPQFFGTALQAEARRRGFRLTVVSESTEELSGGLLAHRPAPGTTPPRHLVVLPASEVLLEHFLTLDRAAQARFAETRSAAWRAARAAWSDGRTTVWWVTPVPLTEGLDAPEAAGSFRRQLRLLREALWQDATQEPNLRLIDLESLAAEAGRAAVHSPAWWHRARLALALDFLPRLAHLTLELLTAAAGRQRKVVVCDLDHTLWGGILAEDGAAGLRLGPEGEGASFLALHRWLQALRARGLLLALCSKNDAAQALDALATHPGSLLRPADFAAHRINWLPKSENLRSLAEELGLGLDSFVFLDDQAFERAEVRTRCPEVCVPDLPEAPEDRLPSLQSLRLFEGQAGGTDLDRTALRQAEQARSAAQAAHLSYGDYLAALELRATVDPLTPANLERVLELSLRSNQFNFLTQRYTRASLESALTAPDVAWVVLGLRDRYGDYGLVAVAELQAHPERPGVARVANWFMSCRVLQRGVEAFTVNALVAAAQARGWTELELERRPTEKNGLVATLPESLGWERTAPDRWRLPLSGWAARTTPVQLTPA